MIKILSKEAIGAADQHTIENEPISSLDLMERAAERAFEKISALFLQKGEKKEFAVFCGIGNNGGDGLVIARKLLEQKHEVRVYLVELSSSLSKDLRANLERLTVSEKRLNEGEHEVDIADDVIVIDAIFGTGLSRPVEGFAKQLIEDINDQSSCTVSIDLPSGLYADEGITSEKQIAIRANHTLTFESPKRCFLFPELAAYVGNWQVVPIGLDREFIRKVKCDDYLLSLQDAKEMLRTRNPFSHKGDFGKGFIVAGSRGKMGAAVLAAKACLRSGIGLLTLQVPACGEPVLQTAVPEAMVLADKQENYVSELKKEASYTAIGIGPGLGKASSTQNLLKLIIQQNEAPMVIDADALNILAENPTWLSFLTAGSILTPHFGELERLVGKWSTAEERMKKQKMFARKFNIYLLVKGKYSSISCPDGKVFFNPTGNVGMATGGSGDALAGVLTALLAQSYSPQHAALFGTYLHGLAGDIAAKKIGVESLLPSDLIRSISDAYGEIKME